MNEKALIFKPYTWLLLTLFIISPCMIFADVDQLNDLESSIVEQGLEKSEPSPTKEKKEVASILESDLVVKAIFTLFFSEILMFSATENEQETLLKQLTPQALATNLLHTYSSNFIATLAHELGHALAAKLLNGDPIDVHLGANSSYTGKPMLKIGGICIDGISPIKGYAKRSPIYKNEAEKKRIEEALNQKVHEISEALALNQSEDKVREKILELAIIAKTRKINKPKNAIIALAGGASGIIAHFTMKSLLHFMCNNRNKPWREKAKTAVWKGGFAIDDIYTHQIMNMLVPYTTSYKEESDSLTSDKQTLINLVINFLEEDKKSDGTMFWEKCVGLPPSVMSTAEYAAVPIDFAAPCFAAYREATAAHKKNKNYQSSLISQCAIGLINQNLQGFLHFHV
jgi:hypothetical protein